MLSRIQKLSLVCSILCFGLTLFSYFKLASWIFLLCFFLYTSFLFLFSYLCYRSSQGQSDASEELSDRIDAIKLEWKEETDQLKTQLEEKEQSITTLTEELTSFQETNTAFMMKIEELQLENARQQASIKDLEAAPAPSSVLPQTLPEPSESTMVNLIAVTKSVIRELHDDAVHAGITIQMSAPEEELLLPADQNMLRILFRNIIDNSIKYMKRHGSLIITASSIGEDIFVVCKDTGNGLSEAETAHIFDLNYQGSNRISGNGLGLFQAKAIVDYYGGTIYAKSNSGKGMGIYIQLPAA